MAITRERLQIEIEARATGQNEADEINEALERLGEDLDSVGGKTRRFNSSLNSTKTTSAAVQKQIAAISAEFEGMAKNIDGIDLRSFHAGAASVSKSQAAVAELAIESMNAANAQKEMSGANKAVAKSLMLVNTNAKQTVGTYQALAASVTAAASFITSLVNAFHLLVNVMTPENLKNLASVAAILSTMARIRGNSALADGLQLASEKALQLAGAIERIQSGEALKELESRANLASKALGILSFAFASLKTTAMVFLGLGLVRSFQNMAAATNNFSAIVNTLKMGDLGAKAKAVVSDLGEMGKGFKFSGEQASKFSQTMLGLSPFDRFIAGSRDIIRSSNDIVRNLWAVKDSAGGLAGIGRLVADSMKKGFLEAGKDVLTFRASIIQMAKGAASVRPNLLSLAESGALVGPALFYAGQAAWDTNSKFLKFAGGIAVVAGLLMGGFAVAVGYALHMVGSLAIAIGSKLLSAMEAFELKAQESQKSMALFTFVLQGFAREIGEKAVGSLGFWRAEMEKYRDTTVIAGKDIAKSIKLLVAEGSVLGITAEENARLLGRAIDVASAHGRDLEDVTQAIVKGLVGQGQALTAMGLDVSDASIEHSKYAHELGLTASEMDEATKVQARFAVLMERTAPLVGAAASEIRTISGATAMYEKKLDQVKIKLGEQGALTVMFTNAMTNLASAFLSLPNAVLDTLGILQDFLGVSLVIIGNMLKYALILSTLSFAYSVLTKAISSNVIVQGILNKLFAATAARVGVNVVATNSLSAAFMNLARVTKGSLILGLRALGVALLGVAATIGKVTWAILSNPLFWKAALIVGGIMAIIEAFQEMNKELEFLNREQGDLAGSTKAAMDAQKAQAGVFAVAGEAAKGFWRVAVDLAKLMLGGFVGAYLAASRAVLLFNRAISKSPADIAKINEGLADNQIAINQTRDFLKNTGKDIGKAFESSALAADGFGESINKVMTKMEKFNHQNERLNTLTAQAMDPALLKAQALGDEFEKSAAAYQEANHKFQTAMTNFRNMPTPKKEDEEGVVKLRVEAAQAYLAMIKTQGDAVKKFSDQTSQYNQDALKDQNQLVEAERLAGAQRVAEFERQVKSLKTNIGLSAQQKKSIEESRKALELFNKSAMAKAKLDQDAKTQERAINAFDDITKQMRETQKEMDKYGKNTIELAAIEANATLKAIDNAEAELKAVNALTEGRQAELDAARAAANAKQAQDVAKKYGNSPAAAAIGSGIESATAGLASAAAPMMGVIGAANGLLDTAQGIVDAIPGLLDKVSGLLDSLTNFGPTLTKSIQGLMDSLNGFVENFAPNIINAVTDILDSLISGILEKLPDSFMRMLSEGLPKAVERLAEKMPEMASRFVFGVITFAPKIAVALINFLIRGIPRIIKALIKSLPLIAKAIVEAIVEAFKAIIGMIKGLFTGDFDFGGIEEGAKNLVNTISGQSSEIFRVIDAEAVQRGADQAKFVAKQIDDAIGRLWDILSMLWNAFVKMVKEVFNWVWMTIFQPIVDLVKKAFQWVIDNVLMPIATFVMKAFQWVIDNVIMPIAGVVKKAFEWVVDNIITPLREVGKDIWNGMKAGLDGAADFFTKIGTKIWNGLKEGLSGLGNYIKDQLSALNPGNLFEKIFKMDMKGTGTVEKVLNVDVPFANFASGGVVGGNPVVGGDSILNDRILAMLSPGEAVIPRSLMSDPDVKALVEGILSGKVNPPGFATGGILGDILEGAGGLLGGISAKVTKALGSAAGPIKSTLSDRSWKGLTEAIEAGMNPRTVGLGPLQGAVGSFSEAIKVMNKLGRTISGASKKGISDTRAELGRAGENASAVAKYMDPSKLWALVKEETFGSVMKMMEANRFHSGGMAYAANGGMFKPKGVDMIPAMVEPGEFIVSKVGVNAVGQDFLETVNSGRRPGGDGGGTVIQVTNNFTITTTKPVDAAMIDKEITPRVMEKLRTASLEGRRILSPKGVQR